MGEGEKEGKKKKGKRKGSMKRGEEGWEKRKKGEEKKAWG